MNAPTPEELGAVAGALGTTEFLIEKDWHVVQVLALITHIEFDGVTTVFSGGTSLSKAHNAIRRFSEDIDFRCTLRVSPETSANQRRVLRRAYFNHVKSSLDQGGYRVIDEHVRDEYRSFQLAIEYPTIIVRSADEVLRPHIQLEISFHPPVLPAVEQTISSFVGQGRRAAAEIPVINCTDLVETGADKFSALVWRLTSAHLGKRADAYKPELMRHVHDLAAIETELMERKVEFLRLAIQSIQSDLQRGDLEDVGDIVQIVTIFMTAIEARDPLPDDYNAFIGNYVFAPQAQRITYLEARDAVIRLSKIVIASYD